MAPKSDVGGRSLIRLFLLTASQSPAPSLEHPGVLARHSSQSLHKSCLLTRIFRLHVEEARRDGLSFSLVGNLRPSLL